MTTSPAPLPRIALAALLAGVLAGCSTTTPGNDAPGGGNVFSNLIFYGGTTAPPEAPVPLDDIDCPTVTIPDGGAAIRLGGAEASSVVHQITLGQTARECRPSGTDGTYTLKVGVEGRGLLGPAGRGGRIEAPVRVVVRRGSTVIAQRVQRASMTLGGTDAQASFIVIEDGIVVQPGSGEVVVEVSLGAGPRQPARQSRRR